MVGKTISHYRIVEKLGEGGMGVVYKAEDTHLDRFVALKVLPADKVSSAERKRRFVQEAKAASALNHPNIVHVYDIAEAEGVDYIAMEYVPGKTLDRVVPRGGLPVSEVLTYTVQIADALSKAHAAGIVHRDLKPSNLIDDGRVRVLDFGLAKLTDPQEVSAEEVTRTVALEDDQLTEAGTILGTSSYMSPEQAEGKVVDRRSDVFSFGVVLYEMVTGRRAFRGNTNMSTLALIINQEPKPVGEVADDVPGELERIINRCLRKNPARRFQHMEDLCVALLELKEESDSGTLGVGRAGMAAPRKRVRWWPAAVVGAALLGIAGGWLFRQGPETGTEGAVGELGSSLLVPVPLTTYPGQERYPDFSPDGDRVVFTWDGESGENEDIYIKLIGEATAQRLTVDPAPDTNPKWSPDGRLIAFVRFGEDVAQLILVPSIGGPERVLLTFNESVNSGFARLAW